MWQLAWKKSYNKINKVLCECESTSTKLLKDFLYEISAKVLSLNSFSQKKWPRATEYTGNAAFLNAGKLRITSGF